MNIAFTLNGRPVRPNYSQGLALVSSRESNERFSRTTLSEDLVFVGQDYDWIVAQAFDTKFILHMVAGSMTWDGVFWKTDCEFNADDRTCKVTPDPYDYYKAVLDGIEKEYDLVKLCPASESVGMHKRDILQLYAITDNVGDRILTNVVGGSTWEQDLAASSADVTPTKLTNDWGFSLQKSIFAYQIGDDSFRGMYYGTKYTTITQTPLVFEGPVYNLKLWMWQAGSSSGSMYYYCRALFTKDTDTQVAGTYAQTQTGSSTSTQPFQETVELGNGTVATARSADIYARFICGDDYAYSTARPAEDIIEYDLNYPNMYPTDICTSDDALMISTFTQTAPTEWGKNSYGYYFVRPDPYNDLDYLPFARSTWSPFSLWVWAGAVLIHRYSDYSLNDAYPIEAAINVLLDEITGDSGKPVTFDIADSLFLNGDSSLRTGRKLFIAQLTNVKKTYYQNAAQTGKITLRQIFDMLRQCFHCYWHIDSEGGLHIEHVLWYINGGTYSSYLRTVSVDLTGMVNPRNSHTWDFGQNAYTFDKVSLPERTELSFASSQTLPFNGLAIQYISGYVKKGQTEKVTVNNMYSDIDWLISGASKTGDEGWAVIDATDTQGVYDCPIVPLIYDWGRFYSQNGYMAFAYLETTFFSYDMSAPDAELQGGYPLTCDETVKARTQNVTFPQSVALPDFALIKTGLGEGEIDSIQYNLMSGSASAELKLPTEDE